MERFDGDIRALDGPLQEAPEVFAAVGVDLPVHVFLGVVDKFVGVIALKSAIRQERIGVDVGANFYVLTNVGLEAASLESAKNFHPNLADAVLAVPIQQ